MAVAGRVLPPPPFEAQKPATPLPVDFGPDVSVTPKTPPKVNQDKPPRPSPLSQLGQNKKLRSPVRKLSREPAKENELSDWDRLGGWYLRIAKIVRPLRPALSAAIEEQAEDCVNAWFDLAENNDKVRRWILGLIEGGDWGKVIAAHTPLFMAVLPERTIERIMLFGMELFQKHAQEDEGESFEQAFMNGNGFGG